ncbi:hypothetical protein HNR65_003565 [Desulfosalsimonas propionicica]|uniref:Uncharacterized protein n=1 Tax=Desulfosalsimonas propionicica TaxID=332175 RepID=A0A7W0HMC3_9BACT|nr:hypothetical protein [Desulfosalsimonas propionicica]MBA2883203.1 hypothetical protein [Desulfosalsimonas propionicica]
MKKLSFLFILVLAIYIILPSPFAFGWAVDNHADISEEAARHSVLGEGYGDFVKTGVGLRNGLDENLEHNNKEEKSVINWLKHGAKNEDAKCGEDSDVSCQYYWGRFNHHFHNPLKIWDNAGLSDFWIGDSSLLWAQEDSQTWSWNNIRDFYYEALTSTELGWKERRSGLADVFMGIGHQLHLVQDKAVPCHARNDSHSEETFVPDFIQRLGGGLYFESWAADKNNRNLVKNLAKNQIKPALDLQDKIEEKLPVAKFIDTNTYDGTNPSASLSIGLSEFTNPNFFSSDTIFTEEYDQDHKHYFPYPRKSDTNIQDFIDELPGIKILTDSGDTEFVISMKSDRMEIEHFVQPTYHTRALTGNYPIYWKTFYLSEKCHEDYAEKLVPRASGYSAELINYFFRGSIDISLPESGVYAMLDSDVDRSDYDSAENVFDSIMLRAKNTSLFDEELSDGKILLVIEYRTVLEYPFQSFYDLWIDSGYLPEYSEYHYTVVESGRRSIPDSLVEIEFDLNHDPIPLNAVDLSLYLVYRGELGAEENGVAVGYKNLSEPTPFAVYNTCDQICINEEWYEAGSDEAVDIVDENGDGFANPYYCDENDICYEAEHDVYQHGAEEICIAFHPTDIPRAADCESTNEKNGEIFITSLEPGEHYRFFLLSDDEYGFTVNKANYVVPENHCPPGFPYPDYGWTHEKFTGGTYTGPGTIHGTSTEGNNVLPLFHEVYNTESTMAYWLFNSEYPPDASDEGECRCEFGNL